jgi:hypothetical protein
MDGQVANNSMDTGQVPQPQAPELPLNFSSIVVPHADVPLHSDISLLSNPLSHIMLELPAAFPNEAHQPNGMPASIHVPIPDLSSSNIPPMDILDSSSPLRAPPPRFIPDFPQAPESFGIGAGLDNDMGMDSSLDLSSGPNVQARDTSPSIHTATSGYSQGTSSLASALDTVGLSIGHNHTGSPETLISSVSGLGYSSGSNIPLTDASGILFPASEFNNGINDRQELSPDRTGGPPLMAVGDLLEGSAQLLAWSHNLLTIL